MPKYTLLHGGLTVKVKSKNKEGEEVEIHHAAKCGDEVDLSTDEAAKLNKRGEIVKLTAQIEAEAKAEEFKKKRLAELTAEVEAKLKAELEAEAKKKGGAK